MNLSETEVLKPVFERQGNFTICLLADPFAERMFIGATVVGPGDTYNAVIGQAISHGRAMAARAEFYARYAYAQ